MSNKQIIFHVGLGRTGTSFLQKKVFPYINDIPSGEQESTLNPKLIPGFGWSPVAELTGGPVPLTLTQQGAGWGDYMIFTGINPFNNAYDPSDLILFYIETSGHNDGGETIFISGEYAGEMVPEPMSLLLFGSGLLGLIATRIKKRIACSG